MAVKASDLRSSGRGFDSRSGRYQATEVYSVFHPSGVGKSSNRPGWLGLRWGAFTCVDWQVTLCGPMWQVTLCSSVMGVPLRAILGFHLSTFQFRDWRHNYKQGVPTLQIFSSVEMPWPLSNTMLLGTIWVSLPNGMLFRPTTSAGCTGVTDDTHTDRPRYGSICRNRRHCCFQRCRQKWNCWMKVEHSWRRDGNAVSLPLFATPCMSLRHCRLQLLWMGLVASVDTIHGAIDDAVYIWTLYIKYCYRLSGLSIDCDRILDCRPTVMMMMMMMMMSPFVILRTVWNTTCLHAYYCPVLLFC